MKRHKKLKVGDIFSESGLDFADNEKKYLNGAVVLFHLLQINGDRYQFALQKLIELAYGPLELNK